MLLVLRPLPHVHWGTKEQDEVKETNSCAMPGRDYIFLSHRRLLKRSAMPWVYGGPRNQGYKKKPNQKRERRQKWKLFGYEVMETRRKRVTSCMIQVRGCLSWLTTLYDYLRICLSMLRRSCGSYSALSVIISHSVLFIIYNISLSEDTVTGYKILRATY